MNRPLGHCGRGQERDRLLGQRLGAIREAEAPDELIAGGLPATTRIGVRPALMLVAVDGVRFHGRPDVGDRLFRVRAVGRGEGLPLALGRVHRFGEGDALDPGGRLVGGEQVGDLALERDRERVLLDRASRTCPWPGGRPSRTIGSRRAVALARAMRTASPATRSASRHRQDVAAGESPRAIDQDADAEPFALPGGDAFDPTGLDGDRFVEPADDAYVRIPRAQGRGRIEGALGQVSHAAANLAEGSASDSRANDVFQRAGAAPTA